MTKLNWSHLFCITLGMFVFQMARSQAQRPADAGSVDSLDDPRLVASLLVELDQSQDLHKVGQGRLETARKNLELHNQLIATGRESPHTAFDASRKLLDTELALLNTDAERMAALQRHWLVARRAEEIAKAMYKSAKMGKESLYRVTLARLEVEYELVKAKNQAKESSVSPSVSPEAVTTPAPWRPSCWRRWR